MTDRELLQMALDALEEAQDYTSCPTYSPSMTQQCAVAAVALRARLALPEPAECDGGQCGIGGYCKQCPKTQLEQEPVAWKVWTVHNHIFFSIGVQTFQINDVLEHQPEVIAKEFSEWLATQLRHALTLLSTTPPQREWVGLTDDEHMKLAEEWGCLSADWVLYAAAVERKLKDKNNGL